MLAWRVAHDRLLHGTALPFDAAVFRARHERAMAHAGTEEPVTAHAHLAVPSRGAELASVTVPTLVVEAPEDPVHPPPAAPTLAAALGGARLVTIPGMGHVAGDAAAARLAGIVLEHTLSIPTSARLLLTRKGVTHRPNGGARLGYRPTSGAAETP